jgi:hypothetical protein
MWDSDGFWAAVGGGVVETACFSRSLALVFEMSAREVGYLVKSLSSVGIRNFRPNSVRRIPKIKRET